MKSTLVGEIIRELAARGYTVADCTGTQTCFDVLAKKDDKTFILKALSNIEGLTSNSARDIKKVARLLSATPLVVGERMKNAGLSRGVVYERHGIHVLSDRTFIDFIGDTPPEVYSVRGNYCVSADQEKLKRMRTRAGLTQDDLADKLGVSKQSVYRYESSGRVSLDMAGKLRDLFGFEITSMGADLSSTLVEGPPKTGKVSEPRLSSLKRDVASTFKGIGFKTSITNAPFDMFVTEKKSVYTAVSDDWRRLERKIEIIDDVSEIMGGYSVCITRRRVKNHENVMKPRELSEIKTVREFLKRLTER